MPLGFIASVILCSALAMIIHELGHLFVARRLGISASELGLGLGPRIFGFRVGSTTFTLRAIPVASFVRLDGSALRQRSTSQQLLVHLAGIICNLALAFLAHGTVFGWANLLLAIGNLLPLYKHDGWRCGVVLMRALLRYKSKPVEWAFTISGCFTTLVIVDVLIQAIRLR